MNYRIFELRAAKTAGCNDADLDACLEFMEKYDYRLGVFLCSAAGVPEKLIGADGGEPEDQTLGRDWSWVVDALNAAYQLGKESSK